MSRYFNSEDEFRFVFPIDGDCLNENDGTVLQDGTLETEVAVCAPAGHTLTVNGVTASESSGTYKARITLAYRRNVLTACDSDTGAERTVTVFRLPECTGKFRLSSDDNILFLQDITTHKDEYTSVFENPYLAVYKKAHDLYGARVHLNLFYETDQRALSCFSSDRPYFNLSMMTDKFKKEFAANSDWLKLAFHSRSEFPDKPYMNASAEQITADAAAVYREIIRFAGAECISDVTTVHWGEANHACTRALRDLGMRGLTGYFEHNHRGQPLVSYYAPDDLIDHVGSRDFWYDKEEDMFFGRIDLVLNMRTCAENHVMLSEIAADPHRGGFVSVLIHEQYYYPDYKHYLPDFADRVLDACALLNSLGYTGCHIGDIIKVQHLKENRKFGGQT